MRRIDIQIRKAKINKHAMWSVVVIKDGNVLVVVMVVAVDERL